MSAAFRTRSLPLLVMAAVTLALPAPNRASAADRDVRSEAQRILSNKCFACHGPDESSREAELRLDTLEGATRDGGNGAAIVPSNPDASQLVRRILSKDADELMPPPDSKLSLSDDERQTLLTWIRQGASYEPHWAFGALHRPPAPSVSTPSDWALTPVDQFVLAKLRDAGLTPSPDAERGVLIRRVYLDLLGIPPSPGEVRSFLTDRSSLAYDRMVDRALSSPHYGERWGRHWLDQARYADTHGYTVDSERTMWPYRDWVIEAVNLDLPFDQFTVEQLAGDLLPAATQSQKIATGFHRNTLVNQEGGSDREQFRNEAVVDRTNTTGAVWLGLTLGCAQCHSHKYDPISQREYYQLFAFFNSQEDANGVAPTLQVASPAQQTQLSELDAEVAAAKQALTDYDRGQDQQRPVAERNDGEPVKWQVVELADPSSRAGASFERLDDGSWVVSGENADDDQYVLPLRGLPARVTAVRLETLTHPSLPQGGPGRAGNGNFVLNAIELKRGEQTAAWLHATADHSQQDYPVTAAIDGDLATGWAINVSNGRMNVNRTATFVTKPLEHVAAKDGDDDGDNDGDNDGDKDGGKDGDKDNDKVAGRGELTLRFGATPPKYNIGRFRVSVTDAPLSKLALPDSRRAELEQAVKRAEAKRGELAKRLPSTMVMRELPKPRESHVHIRGDFLRKGDAVTPNVPDLLPPLRRDEVEPTEPTEPTEPAELANRLDLARWLVRGDNPLTPRVTVNRVWGRLFGLGLVETENDFGMQGTPPSHPELLDWLAVDFRDHGWSLKRLHRQILTSRVYRQSSRHREELSSVDPLNKLLGRQNRLRVDAEVVRDLSLSVSGLLSHGIGGPSVRPPQPDGVYAFTQRSAAWPTSKGADRYRRGLYTFFMRSAPYPMLTTFDTPRFNTTCTRRVRSNTPLQALTLANDATMLEAARALGRRLHDHSGGVEEQLSLAYQLCFSRGIEPAELRTLQDYLAAEQASFADSAERARDLLGESDASSADPKAVTDQAARAAWVSVARVLLNLDEFIVRE
ncbi:MAG: PSD1 domain-containing protein [Planctomycetales bacterium]|nr:PSD1 domain-containing protein [Planctomycetales bacterium]